MKILIIGGIATSLVNFRGSLIKGIIAKGHKVLACSGEPSDCVEKKLREWGGNYVPVNLSRAGTSFLEDLRTLRELRKIIIDFEPDIIFPYTIKPVIWGSFAARSIKSAKTFSLITGLGYTFQNQRKIKGRLINIIVRHLYRESLKSNVKVFFQNPDDKDDFVRLGLINKRKAVVINGSGVDLKYYAPARLPENNSFLFVGRLIADKGIREYLDAVNILHDIEGVEWNLIGDTDSNPASLSEMEIQDWREKKYFNYSAQIDDIRLALKKCSVFVLPSYREGTPRTVLEAMSMGRPIITCDSPGCRETVMGPYRQFGMIKQGANGFLVPVRDSKSLAKAMRLFIDQPNLIIQMGKASRAIAEKKYDVNKINEIIFEVMGI
jgi:glycosyltransferase involved in cell wall biosynthesis